ncbi:MAG: haloacid dehalogenase-like hydrolase [Clostridia bacterium]|nr:haloacid dehalogenase-like hydrolase [Clostridia bacterium]
MNVYDFDKTIFVGDSEDRFFEYIFSKPGFGHWKLYWHIMDKLYKAKILSRTASRQQQYRFLKDIPDVDKTVEEYWETVWQYMMPWYFEVKRDDDVIATGTPRFLLEPAMRRLGLTNLVATEMDRHTGRIEGKFAIKADKLDHFDRQFGKENIDKFYSDDYADNFLAQYAKEAYACKDGNIYPWTEYFEAHPELKNKVQFR